MSPATARRVWGFSIPSYARQCGDGGNLYLQVSRYGGSASWVFRYRVGPRRLRDHGLGSLDTWSLAEARERARECRQLRGQGRDPIEERRAEREKAQLEAASAMTFRQCAEACHKNPAFLPAPMPRL